MQAEVPCNRGQVSSVAPLVVSAARTVANGDRQAPQIRRRSNWTGSSTTERV